MSLVERARGVLEEIGRIQAGVFEGGEGSGRLDREYPSSLSVQSSSRDCKHG
jgi:hypothetical protein